MQLLKDKIAIVTGGSSGIGEAAAKLYVQEGACVVVADIAVEKGEAVVHEIINNGGEAIFVKTDVSKAEEIERLVKETIKKYGKLDVAFNNAGMASKTIPIVEYPIEAWEKCVRINLFSIFYCAHYQIPEMLKNGGGAIVNTASMMARIAAFGNSPYVAAKHGIAGFTKSIAVEYGKQGIRANAIAPGVIAPPMLYDETPQEYISEMIKKQTSGRFGTAEDIANIAVWLSSDKSAFCNGELIMADGGLTITDR